MPSLPRSSGWVYAFGVIGMDLVKIGSTGRGVERRFKAVKQGFPFPLHIIASVKIAHDYDRIEREMHALLHDCRRGGEWFATGIDQPRFIDLVDKAIAQSVLRQKQWALMREELKQRALEGKTPRGRPRKYPDIQTTWRENKRQQRHTTPPA